MNNIVIIHLESLNHLLFSGREELFPTLYEIKRHGIYYRNYFSTATSTLMVIGDLMYGGMYQYEVCKALDDIPYEYYYNTSLFDDLKIEGYKTGIFIYPDGGDRESAEERHIAGFDNNMVLKRGYEDFLLAMDNLMSKEPFAIMSCNYISNMALNLYTDKQCEQNGFDRWEKAYIQMDVCVRNIVAMLKKRGVFERTSIILYGDHGDDMWGHGLHAGLTHAVEPYAQLIHTPLIVAGLNIESTIENNLICTTDLRQMIMLLATGKKCYYASKIPRDYVVSRSAYAAQPLRKESFNKAYSITDGNFLLMVSNRGLEMYNIKMDPQCSFNFLEIFKYKEGILQYDHKIYDEMKYHYKTFMNDLTVMEIRQTFYRMRVRLIEQCKQLYRAGQCGLEKMDSEMMFNHINHRNKSY